MKKGKNSNIVIIAISSIIVIVLLTLIGISLYKVNTIENESLPEVLGEIDNNKKNTTNLANNLSEKIDGLDTSVSSELAKIISNQKKYNSAASKDNETKYGELNTYFVENYESLLNVINENYSRLDASLLTSSERTEEKLVSRLENINSNLTEYRNDLTTRLNNIYNRQYDYNLALSTNLTSYYNNLNLKVSNVNATVGMIRTNLTNYKDELVSQISASYNNLAGGLNKISSIQSQYYNDLDRKLTSLNTTELSNKLDTVSSNLGTIANNITGIKTTVEANAETLAGINTSLNGINSTLGTTSSTLTTINTNISTINTTLTTMNGTLTNILTALNVNILDNDAYNALVTAYEEVSSLDRDTTAKQVEQIVKYLKDNGYLRTN